MASPDKETVESFVFKLQDELDYNLENYCPDDEKLTDLKDQIVELKKQFLNRVKELAKEVGLDEEHEVHEILDELGAD